MRHDDQRDRPRSGRPRGKVVLGTTAHIEGIVLAQTSVTLRTGASIKGGMLAQSAVAIDKATIVSAQ